MEDKIYNGCEYCNNRCLEEDLQGTDGIIYDRENKKHFLSIQLHEDKRFKKEIDYCPVCGEKLSITKEDIKEQLIEMWLRKGKYEGLGYLSGYEEITNEFKRLLKILDVFIDEDDKYDFTQETYERGVQVQICDECNRFMLEGYVVNHRSEMYDTVECMNKNGMTLEQFYEEEDKEDSSCYYYEWYFN